MKKQEIASLAGVTTNHLSAILHGRRRPSVKLAETLERLTGVSRVVWIFGTAQERRAALKAARETREEVMQ